METDLHFAGYSANGRTKTQTYKLRLGSSEVLISITGPNSNDQAEKVAQKLQAIWNQSQDAKRFLLT
jgi:hypothetical protein